MSTTTSCRIRLCRPLLSISRQNRRQSPPYRRQSPPYRRQSPPYRRHAVDFVAIACIVGTCRRLDIRTRKRHSEVNRQGLSNRDNVVAEFANKLISLYHRYLYGAPLVPLQRTENISFIWWPPHRYLVSVQQMAPPQTEVADI